VNPPEELTPEQALSVLDHALQPGFRLARADYVLIQDALEILAKIVKPAAAPAAQVADHG
jgi:hypothetical protein